MWMQIWFTITAKDERLYEITPSLYSYRAGADNKNTSPWSITTTEILETFSNKSFLDLQM